MLSGGLTKAPPRFSVRRCAPLHRPRKNWCGGSEDAGESRRAPRMEVSGMEVSWEKMVQILRSARTVAVVGLSDKPDRPSNEIARYLQKAGYRIIPVNPRLAETLGERAYQIGRAPV